MYIQSSKYHKTYHSDWNDVHQLRDFIYGGPTLLQQTSPSFPSPAAAALDHPTAGRRRATHLADGGAA